MSIHYKFKSALEYDTITFDGLHISVKDLKNSILQQKRIGKNSDFDLQVTNAQTKEVYSDEDALIPKNTSLLIARVPLSVPNKGKSWEGYGAVDTGASARLDDGGPIGKAADLSSLDASEDEKIRAMISQSTQEYDPSNYLKVRGANQVGPVPQNYKCYKCHLGGHWIKDCPLGLSADSVEIKKSTGIPKSFMRQVAGPDVAGAMITPNGSYAVHCNTVEDSAPTSGVQGGDGGVGNNAPPLGPTFTTRADIPEDLLCSICDDLLVDAVMIPCCGNSFCDECVRNSLLESEEHECPDCHERDIAPTTLIPNRFLRKSVATFKNESGYVKKYREPRIVLPKKTEEQRPSAADSSTIASNPLESSGKTIISEADSTETAKLAAISDAPKAECKEEPDKTPLVAAETPAANPTNVPAQEKLPKDVRPITNVATTYRENRQHGRERERTDNANVRYRVPTGTYQRGDRSPGTSQRSNYRRSPQRTGLVREDRSDTPTIDEPGLGGLCPAPDPQRDYAPPPGTFMNPEPGPRAPLAVMQPVQGAPMQQMPPIMQQPPPGPMQMIHAPPQMQLPPPGMSVPPPGPYASMPPQLGMPGVFSPGMPPNFRHPPPGAPPPLQTAYMPGPYSVPPRPIFDGSRGPPPLIQPPINIGYPPHFANRGRPGFQPRGGITVHTPPNVIDDPLEAFNRILREKDERRRRAQAQAQAQRRSYSRSRSSSRSYSRSPAGRRGAASPRRRSRSRSVRSGRSPMGRERSPRSFSISRSRSRSRSLSPFMGGSRDRDRDRDRDYSPSLYHYHAHQPPPHHHQHHHHHSRTDHYPPSHHAHHHHNNSPPPLYSGKYGAQAPPTTHYPRGSGRRYRSPQTAHGTATGRNNSPPQASRGYNNSSGGFKDTRERHYDHYAGSSRDVSATNSKPTMAELALSRADHRYRNTDRDYTASTSSPAPSSRDLRENLRTDQTAANQRHTSRSPQPSSSSTATSAATGGGKRFSPSSRHGGGSSRAQSQQVAAVAAAAPPSSSSSDKRGRSKERDRDVRSERDSGGGGGGKDREWEKERGRGDVAPSVGGGGGVVADLFMPLGGLQSVGGAVVTETAVDYNNRFVARPQVTQPTAHYPLALDMVAPPGTTEQPLPPGEDLPPPPQHYAPPTEQPALPHEHMQPYNVQQQQQHKQFAAHEDKRGRYGNDLWDKGKDNYDSPDRRKTTSRRPSSPVRMRKEHSDDDRRNRKADKKKKRDRKEQEKKKKRDKREGDRKEKKKSREKADEEDKEDKTVAEQVVVEKEELVVDQLPPPPPDVAPINDLYGDLITAEIVDTNIVQSYGKLPQMSPIVEPPDETVSTSPALASVAVVDAAMPLEEDTEVDNNKDMETDVLELHSQEEDVEEEEEEDRDPLPLPLPLLPLPEKSKWETDGADDVPVTDTKPEDATKKDTKVSSEVLKRAENAIFAKAINAIRPPIEIKKISLDRAKLYSSKLDTEDLPRNVHITVKNDHYDGTADVTATQQQQLTDVVDVLAVEQKPQQQQQQQRLSVKERLGCKVDDLDRIIRIDATRPRSKTASPPRKHTSKRSEASGRRDQQTRYNSRDKDRMARSYRNAERSRSDDKRDDCRKKLQENRSKTAKLTADIKKKRRSRSKSTDRKKDARRMRNKDSSSSNAKTAPKPTDTSKKHTNDSKRQKSAEPAPPGTEDTSPPPRKVAIVAKQRKSTLDEASFEPDYDLEVASDGDKTKRSTTPQLVVVAQQKNVATAVAVVTKERDTSSESSSSGERKRKKPPHKKKSKKRRRKESSDSSSESSADSERKRKRHRKKAKKAKKRKHKEK